MRCEVRKNQKGEDYVFWDMGGEGLVSTDFFNDVKSFRLKATILHDLLEGNTIRLYSSEIDIQPYDLSFPLGTILIVKEKQL